MLISRYMLGGLQWCANLVVAPLYFISFTLLAAMVALNLASNAAPSPAAPRSVLPRLPPPRPLPLKLLA